MIGAAVPEAAVDEYRDPRPKERDARATPSVERQRVVDSVAKPHAMERTPHGELRTGFPPPGWHASSP